MQHRPATAVTALLCVAGLAACGGSSAKSSNGDNKSSEDVVKDAAITMALNADPGTLDPTKTLLGSAQQINRFTYDTLVNTNRDGEIVSGLAEKWTVSPTALTFTIRKGVTCADGTPFTAANVKDNFDFLKKSKSPLIGTALPDPSFSVAADANANTFTFTSPTPNGFFLQDLAGIPMVCPKGIAAPATLARSSAGTGPYVLSDFVSGDHVTVSRRDGYTWGPDGASTATAGLPKTVTFKVVSNESTVTNLLLNGQVNIAQLHGTDRTRIREGGGYLVKNVTTDTLVLSFNQRQVPGNDETARLALIQSLNRSDVTKTVTSGTGKVVATLLAVEPRVCDDSPAGSDVPTFDVDKAKAALDAAGWAPGANGVRVKNGKPLKLTLVMGVDSSTAADAAEVMVQGWKAIGADVKIKSIPPAQLTDTLFGKFDYDVILYTLQIQLPSTFYGLLTGPAAPKGTNFSPVNNADYTRLGKEALTTPGDPGCTLWTQAHAALYKHGDLAPVGSVTAAYVGRNTSFDYIAGLIDAMSVRALAK
ncbi:MAG: peptide/nickel transport system substrate-binding protein [Actinomycetota bacterium]|jgi:peptide/nickel transport system substrate-binding protein|nr:peptide/nickel transport system substrate-binding protein [Actinomycetota bacterium]